jgi:hypothetical protein
MPGIGADALSALVLLLPGLLCARLVRRFCVRAAQTELDKLIEALIYSFLIYVIFSLTVDPLSLVPEGQTLGIALRHLATQPKPLLYLTILSVALAISIALVENNDLAAGVLSKLRISRRSPRPSLWNDVFHDHGGYILVELSEGRMILGWLRRFSDYAGEPSLYLEDAAWVAEDQSRVQIEGPGVLLTAASGIKTVMFLRPTDERRSQNRPPN